MDQKLEKRRTQLTGLRARLDAAELRIRLRSRESLGALSGQLKALSPLGVLGRGYSLAWTAQGKLLRRASDVVTGDDVRVDLGQGRLYCRVEKAENERDDG